VARLGLQILALALGAAVAVGLVSCGSRDKSGLVPGTNAQEIQANLSTVDELAAQGDCTDAATAVSAVKAQIDELPSSVDPQLRDRLRAGAVRLENLVNEPGACETTTTTTSSVEPTTTESTTSTEKQKTKSTTTTTQSTTIPTTTSATTPTTTTPPGTTTGGTSGSGGGVVPPGQRKGGGDGNAPGGGGGD
jgi:hypothetical protein